jgi:hypothetical protein
LAFYLIIDGTTEKVLQFIIPLKSVYIYSRGFNAQKMVFLTLHTGSNNKKYINWHSFCHDNVFSVDLFRAALYRFMLVLNSDALFHWWCLFPLKLSAKIYTGWQPILSFITGLMAVPISGIANWLFGSLYKKNTFLKKEKFLKFWKI